MQLQSGYSGALRKHPYVLGDDQLFLYYQKSYKISNNSNANIVLKGLQTEWICLVLQTTILLTGSGVVSVNGKQYKNSVELRNYDVIEIESYSLQFVSFIKNVSLPPCNRMDLVLAQLQKTFPQEKVLFGIDYTNMNIELKTKLESNQSKKQIIKHYLDILYNQNVLDLFNSEFNNQNISSTKCIYPNNVLDNSTPELKYGNDIIDNTDTTNNLQQSNQHYLQKESSFNFLNNNTSENSLTAPIDIFNDNQISPILHGRQSFDIPTIPKTTNKEKDVEEKEIRDDLTKEEEDIELTQIMKLFSDEEKKNKKKPKPPQIPLSVLYKSSACKKLRFEDSFDPMTEFIKNEQFKHDHLD
ncbi:hypothetical protein QTN25_003266 [Entamoeba marina]